MTLFNYTKSEDENFNAIVEGVANSVARVLEGDCNSKEYFDIQSDINFSMAKYLVSGTRYESQFEKKGAEAGELLKNPNVSRNKDVRANFNAIIAQIITTVLPMTTSRAYGEAFMDVHQVGWGDTARFIISSNDLFKVNEIAEGIHRATLQPIYNNEITVNCGTIEVATSIDWYAVAAGVFDWGQFGARAGRSFEGYILLKAIAAMSSATTELGSAYSASGVDTEQWSTLAERVSAANNGARVYALGTLTALNQAIPATVGLQYGLGNEVAKEGFLDKYLGVPLVVIDQVMVPGTVNTTAQLAIPADTIYLIAADQYKPVKVVFEGNSVVVEEIPEYSTDKTYGVSLQMKIGVAAIVGSKFGVITL